MRVINRDSVNRYRWVYIEIYVNSDTLAASNSATTPYRKVYQAVFSL